MSESARAKCSNDWCDKYAKPHGKYCSACYEYRRLHGTFGGPDRAAEGSKKRGAAYSDKFRAENGWGDTCSVGGCDAVPRAKGLCDKHYARYMKTGNPTKTLQKGYHINDMGYKLVKRHGHPHADVRGYVREHILVAEEMIGRSLKDNEVVHHINRERADNRKENLAVMDRGEHVSMHMFAYHGLQARKARNE